MQCWYSNACKIEHEILASEGCDFVLNMYFSEHVNIKAYKYQIHNASKYKYTNTQ